MFINILKNLILLDLNYLFALSRQWLWIFGIWPDPEIPLREFRRPSIRFIIVTCTVMMYVTAPQLMNVIRAWGDVSRMVENFASANFSLLAVCKLLVTWYHGESKFFSRQYKYRIDLFLPFMIKYQS